MVNVAHDPIPSTKLTQVQRKSLLNGSEGVKSVQQLGLALTSRYSREKIMSEEQVLCRFKEAILADFFSVDLLLLEAHFGLGLHTVREDLEELHLVLREVR